MKSDAGLTMDRGFILYDKNNDHNFSNNITTIPQIQQQQQQRV